MSPFLWPNEGRLNKDQNIQPERKAILILRSKKSGVDYFSERWPIILITIFLCNIIIKIITSGKEWLRAEFIKWRKCHTICIPKPNRAILVTSQQELVIHLFVFIFVVFFLWFICTNTTIYGPRLRGKKLAKSWIVCTLISAYAGWVSFCTLFAGSPQMLPQTVWHWTDHLKASYWRGVQWH